MGLFLQLLGVLFLLISLVINIISIINKAVNTGAVALLIVGIALIQLGRNIYKKQS